MVASLPLSVYFENDCTLEISGEETLLHICDAPDKQGRHQMRSASRFMQILNNTVADMDDDETLLTAKDRITILTVNVSQTIV